MTPDKPLPCPTCAKLTLWQKLFRRDPERLADTREAAQVEASARDWAAEVRGLSKLRRSKAVHRIAEREGRPALRVFFWIKWAEKERK